jgi:hypothetical protein
MSKQLPLGESNTDHAHTDLRDHLRSYVATALRLDRSEANLREADLDVLAREVDRVSVEEREKWGFQRTWNHLPSHRPTYTLPSPLQRILSA